MPSSAEMNFEIKAEVSPETLERQEELQARFNKLQEQARKAKQEQEDRATDSVAIVSGGLDSTTLVYDMLQKGYWPHLLSFNYGQRHAKELEFAKYTAKKLKLRHDIVDLRSITHLISNSALTSRFVDNTEPFDADLVDNKRDIEVPEGHYAEDNMRLTVVPNRNMMMLSIATAVAVNENARVVGVGVHAGDHTVYPDCRPSFINSMDLTIALANEGFHNFDVGLPKSNGEPRGWNEPTEDYKPSQVNMIMTDAGDGPIYAPFLFKSKTDIAYRALELKVPLHMTWSCYKGGELHCGRCGTCVERLEAITEAAERARAARIIPDSLHSPDLTVYEDDQYWLEAAKHEV